MQILILGMHRSGTSALTRVVNLMGAYIGAESAMTGANEENPAGFWERKDVRTLCDGVLHDCGADWWRPAGFDPMTVPDDVRTKALDGWKPIGLELDAHQPWVVKEPRLCLVLPLLRPALESPFAVHAHREPLEVAASLQKRNGFPLHVGLALWEHYTVSALRASADLPRAHVWYGDLLADTGATLQRLHDTFEGAGVKGMAVPSADLTGKFLSERLHRQRRDASSRHEHLTMPQRELLELLDRPDSIDGGSLQVSAGAVDVLQSYAQDRLAGERLRQEVTDKEKQQAERLRRLDGELKAASEQVAALSTTQQQLESGLAEARKEQESLAATQQDLDAQRAELERVRDEYLRLRRRRSVRVALRLARTVRPLFAAARRQGAGG